VADATWVGTSARDVARAVRRGDVTATQVVADHLDAIRGHDHELNAFRLVREGEAPAEAEQVDGQDDLAGAWLAGVPVAIKENTAVAGLPTWHGSAPASAPVADSDHEVVRRLRGAGAVVVGTTRMPEFGLWGTTDDDTAVTRNPWQLDHTPGGSSGGSAAAVAAGLVPMATATDGFGSIRIPAACCGLVGLKPGRGVVPTLPGALAWLGLTEQGVLTTTVADAAVGFAVLAGQRPAPLTEPSRLRVAVSLKSPAAGVRPDAANRGAVATAGRLLVAAGHDTVRAEPSYPAWLTVRGIATWVGAAYRVADEAGVDPSTLQPRTRGHLTAGRLAWRRGLVRDIDRQRWREQCEDFLSSYDVMITPALAGAPPAAASWHRRSWPTNLLVNARYAPYAAPWNMAGLPAIVVPVGTRPDGLPLGVQVVGPPSSEHLLLAIAGQIEQAAPWQRHAPGWPRAAT
jgi:amidase